MCGRYIIITSLLDLQKEFDISGTRLDFVPSYNVAPTHQVPAIINANQARRLGSLQWGLVPSWAKDASMASKMINARSETVFEKPSFKNLVRSRRCLIPADGFYEWGQTDKTPYLIRLKNNHPFAFAGLWDIWKSGDQKLATCTIITTEANELLKPLHHRMPVILNKKGQADWLNVTDLTAKSQLEHLFKPFDNDEMMYFEVSKAVNSVKNNSEDLIHQV